MTPSRKSYSGFEIWTAQEPELEALRCAVDRSMKVLRVPTHADVCQYVTEHSQ